MLASCAVAFTASFGPIVSSLLCICLLKLDETLVERLWGLTEMFPETVRTGAEVSAQYSVSVIKKLYRYISEVLQLKNENDVDSTV